MKIAIAQIDTCAGDLDKNAERMIECSKQAAKQGAELLVFPFEVFTGSTELPACEQKAFFFDLNIAVDRLAEELLCPCLIPILLMGERSAQPEVLFVADGGVTHLRLEALMHARNIEHADEDDAFIAENQIIPSFVLSGIHFSVAFTPLDFADISDTDNPPDAVIYIPFFGFAKDDPYTFLAAGLDESDYLRIAEENEYWLIAAGSLGCYDGWLYPGASFIAAPTGQLIAKAPLLEEKLLCHDIDFASHQAFLAPCSAHEDSFTIDYFYWRLLALGLRDFVKHAGYADVVINLDGSITSVALAVLACDAFGPTHVHVFYGYPELYEPRSRFEELLLHNTGTPKTTLQESASQLKFIEGLAKRGARSKDLVQRLQLLEHPNPLAIQNLIAKSYAGAATDREYRDAYAAAVDLINSQITAFARAHSAFILTNANKTTSALHDDISLLPTALAPFGDIYQGDLLDMLKARNSVSNIFESSDLDMYACDLPDLELVDSFEQEPSAFLHEIEEILFARIENECSYRELSSQEKLKGLTKAVLSCMQKADFTRRNANPILAFSSRPLHDFNRPFFYPWSDLESKGTSAQMEEVADFLREMARFITERTSNDAPEEFGDEILQDIMGYVQDLSLSDIARAQQDSSSQGGLDKKGDFLSFNQSPFSEN